MTDWTPEEINKLIDDTYNEGCLDERREIIEILKEECEDCIYLNTHLIKRIERGEAKD